MGGVLGPYVSRAGPEDVELGRPRGRGRIVQRHPEPPEVIVVMVNIVDLMARLVHRADADAVGLRGALRGGQGLPTSTPPTREFISTTSTRTSLTTPVTSP